MALSPEIQAKFDAMKNGAAPALAEAPAEAAPAKRQRVPRPPKAAPAEAVPAEAPASAIAQAYADVAAANERLAALLESLLAEVRGNGAARN